MKELRAISNIIVRKELEDLRNNSKGGIGKSSSELGRACGGLKRQVNESVEIEEAKIIVLANEKDVGSDADRAKEKGERRNTRRKRY